MTKDELKKILGKNIRKYRKENTKKLTQSNLAELVGVKRSLIGAVESENNKTCISVFNLYMISKALNVRIDKFFEGALWKRKYL